MGNTSNPVAQNLQEILSFDESELARLQHAGKSPISHYEPYHIPVLHRLWLAVEEENTITLSFPHTRLRFAAEILALLLEDFLASYFLNEHFNTPQLQFTPAHRREAEQHLQTLQHALKENDSTLISAVIAVLPLFSPCRNVEEEEREEGGEENNISISSSNNSFFFAGSPVTYKLTLLRMVTALLSARHPLAFAHSPEKNNHVLWNARIALEHDLNRYRMLYESADLFPLLKQRFATLTQDSEEDRKKDLHRSSIVVMCDGKMIARSPCAPHSAIPLFQPNDLLMANVAGFALSPGVQRFLQTAFFHSQAIWTGFLGTSLMFYLPKMIAETKASQQINSSVNTADRAIMLQENASAYAGTRSLSQEYILLADPLSHRIERVLVHMYYARRQAEIKQSSADAPEPTSPLFGVFTEIHFPESLHSDSRPYSPLAFPAAPIRFGLYSDKNHVSFFQNYKQQLEMELPRFSFLRRNQISIAVGIGSGLVTSALFLSLCYLVPTLAVTLTIPVLGLGVSLAICSAVIALTIGLLAMAITHQSVKAYRENMQLKTVAPALELLDLDSNTPAPSFGA